MALFFGPVLTGCGGNGTDSDDEARPDNAEKVVFSLDYAIDGLHAPMFVADALGYYAEAGLEVELLPSNGSLDAIARITTGDADVANAAATDVYSAIAKSDAPITALADYARYTPSAVITRKNSGIDSLEDLKGKSVGVNPTGSSGQLFLALLEANGLSRDDVRLVNMNGSAQRAALLNESVDAVAAFAQTWASHLDKVQMLYAYENGITTYATVLAANNRFLEEKPEVAKKFLDATYRGLAYTVANPQEAAEIVAEAANMQSSVDFFISELAILEPLWSSSAEVNGEMKDETWREVQAFAETYADAPAVDSLDAVYTNEFLPSAP